MSHLKQSTLLFFLVFALQFCYGNSDTLLLHNGTQINGEVINITNYTVLFRYKNEKTEQQISKYAIEKIHFGSGRKQWISTKIIINGESDWEKVLILEDKNQNSGLVQVSSIRAYTKFINLHTANTSDIKVSEKLQREAAKLNCPFILINYERETVYNGLIKSWGAIQEIKKAFCYKY